MNKKTVIIISVFALLSIIAIVVGVTFGLQMMKQDTPESEKTMLDKEIYKIDIGEMYCNLSDSRKIVKLNTTLETINEKFTAALAEKEYIIRNEINEIIRSKKEDDVYGSTKQENIQKQIVDRLNKVFNTDSISNVYFNDFIVQ